MRFARPKLTFPILGLAADDCSLIVLVLAIKLFLLCFGAWTYIILDDQRPAPLPIF